MATHRKFLLGVGMVLLALLVFAGVRVVQRLTAKPNIAIDYSAKVREHIEASARARGLSADKAVDARFEAILIDNSAQAAAFVEGMALKDARFTKIDRGIELMDFGLVEAARTELPAEDEIKVELVKLTYANAVATGQLDKLLELRELSSALRDWKANKALLLQMRSIVPEARFAIDLLGVRLREQLAQSDAVGAKQNAETLFALGASVSGWGRMIEGQVGMQSQVVALDAMRQSASRRGTDAATTRAMLEALNKRAALAPAAVALEVERMIILDVIQRVFSDDGSGDGVLLAKELASLRDAGAWFLQIDEAAVAHHPSRKGTTEKVNRYFLTAVAASKDRFADRDASEYQAADQEITNADALLGELLPSPGRFVVSYDRFATTLGATQLLLAIELYCAEHGSPPASLDALVPGILPALPTDAFAPNGSFRYKQRTPTPDDPREFVLYSVGSDGVDSGGRFREGNRRELVLSLSSDAIGYDWLVNTPPSPAASPTPNE